LGALVSKSSDVEQPFFRRERRQTGHFSCLVSNPWITHVSPPRPRHFSLHQAAEGSPTLGSLMARARDSAERLKAVEGLIPPAMRGAIQAGPAEGDVWCLLVKGSAAAAKLRQLRPCWSRA
jgi:hypothetical protein